MMEGVSGAWGRPRSRCGQLVLEVMSQRNMILSVVWDVVRCGHQQFDKVGGQVFAPAGHTCEWGGHGAPFLAGMRVTLVAVGRGMLSLARSILYRASRLRFGLGLLGTGPAPHHGALQVLRSEK